MTVKLGEEVKDIVTGFEGIVVGRTRYLNGCDRIEVQPKAVKAELPKSQFFDEPDLSVIGTGVSVDILPRVKGVIKLGQEVQDKVTGFKGIVVSHYTPNNGCDRLGVQPKAHKNVIPDAILFDEPDLVVTGPGVLKEAKKKSAKTEPTGGPHSHSFEIR